MATSLQTILDQFREDARNNRDLGDRFERLILAYLQLDPLYLDRFSDVWMWNDFPHKGNVGDVGVDLVARDRATGDYCAIQCKFYLPEHTLSKADLDSFFTALGKPVFSSGLIVSTTDKWGKNAEDALEQTKPVTRLSQHNLSESPIDWSTFDARKPGKLTLSTKKKLRPHQQSALKDVVQGLAEADRGKLIMACGTGKTFTALRIAEAVAPAGHLLFLVPSLSLLSQSLREWTAQSEKPIHSLAVCSDINIGKRRTKNQDDFGEITVHDLAFPATTNAKQLVAQYESLKATAKKAKESQQLTVVFSTYQSIDAVSKAQKAGLPAFDLIICDEAHRTTGVTLAGEDESGFVKVHDANFIKARKRLYMTATPRIYGDEAKTKAKEATAELASMDDESLFGKELHRLGFGEAVGMSLLADYKVLVLAVDEKYVSKTFQKQIADKNTELNLDDAVKITGCWNGLAKRFERSTTATDDSGDALDLQGDAAPMRRAVAFSRSIADSKAFVEKTGRIVAAYKDTHPDDTDLLEIDADHVDGTFDALRRGTLLDWLKAPTPSRTCRVLSNARCLSEGVDVPSLDAVLFLNPRNSVIDVVQSVGRVMRKAEGKTYGYIILPIGIPADVKPEEALKNNEKYKVVWQVLQALRAHDDRFNATINQLELNKNRPSNIEVIGVGDFDRTHGSAGPIDSAPAVRTIQGTLAFPQLEEWKDAIYAKMVMKVGQREYLEKWAAEVAVIAERHITRIKALIEDSKSKHTKAFNEFLAGLQRNLNPAVTRDDAIEMLAQHLITGPVFDALFGSSQFTKMNPVSQAMQKMLDLLQEQSIGKEAETLEKFYEAVRRKVEGVDNAEARQTVIKTLYDEFFNKAFPRMAERLGIVYTPVEVVDFIIHSVQDILRDEFSSGLGDKDVHIIDPFTGTGTFIVRLLQSGLIPPDKLLHKYQHELHANEIVLLAYYIAAINIEETFHGLCEGKGNDHYLPFDGIVLTDTFQLYESKQQAFEGTFPENIARVERQKASPIRVIIANPPYSAVQKSVNDNNPNLNYPAIDQRISDTYVSGASGSNKNRVYDSYVRAIRWATDRIKDRGIIGLVTNASYIDGNAMDGLRASITSEFTSVYVFNLRGNQRTSGELSRQEGGKIFGSGSRAPIAITLLVKNPVNNTPAQLYYHDIGDYLDREEKLKLIRDFGSIAGIEAARKWATLKPNAEHDWVNQRDPAFDKFIPIGDKKNGPDACLFEDYAMGVATNRDAWCYSFSSQALLKAMATTIASYNTERKRFHSEHTAATKKEEEASAEAFIDRDPKKVSWTSSLISHLVNNRPLSLQNDAAKIAIYRPFCRCWLYYDKSLNHRQSSNDSIFPASLPNVAIALSGIGGGKESSAIAINCVGDFNLEHSGTQCFPLYLYEPAEDSGKLNLRTMDGEAVDGYHRRDSITDSTLSKFRDAYDAKVTKEDVFYYVYGVLHSPEYRTRFAADLKKMLPRIPLTKDPNDFRAFSDAGRELAEWHVNYETVEPWNLKEHTELLGLDPWKQFAVQKMTFGRATPEQKAAGAKWDKTKIIYNSHVTLSEIPLEAYDYVVNGKPALEWIIERYQVTRDKDSGIVNDPNDWCREHNQPRYIVDLIKRVTRVSIETMKIVGALPALNEQK